VAKRLARGRRLVVNPNSTYVTVCSREKLARAIPPYLQMTTTFSVGSVERFLGVATYRQKSILLWSVHAEELDVSSQRMSALTIFRGLLDHSDVRDKSLDSNM
jgi:L-rhamnose isomerase